MCVYDVAMQEIFKHIADNLTLAVGLVVYFFIIVIPAWIHTGLMIKNISNKIRGRDVWWWDIHVVILHALATIFFIVLSISLFIFFIFDLMH